MQESSTVQRIEPRLLLDALPDVVLALSADATIVFVNDAAIRRGWVPADWLGRNALDLVHPDDLLFAMSSLTTVKGKSEGTPIEIRISHPSEGWRWFEVIGRDVLDDLDVGVLVLSCRDLTERRRWEVAGGDPVRLRSVLQHAAAITLLVTPDGRIDSASAAITRLLGYDPELIAGRRLSELAAPGFASDLDAVFSATARRTSSTIEIQVVALGGGPPIPYRFEIVDLRDDPVVAGYVVTAHDVSDLHKVREELRHRASHDALTGLPNRVGLDALLAQALVLRAPGSKVAVLFVDLDRFKTVNDLLGHDAGDELLIEFADRLRSLVRPDDSVLRLGGDEFVVIATGLRSRRDADGFARRVAKVAAQRFQLASGVVHVTASVGVALAESEANPAMLLAEADNAMYQVKFARRQAAGRRTRRVSERRALAGALGGAVGRGEIEPWFQPIVATADGRLLGFEALARWRTPSGEVLVPADFFDVAEEMGLGTTIDAAMLDIACRDMASMDVDPSTWVSVNFSAGDLADDAIIRLVSATLSKSGLAATRLCIEVTEQSILDGPGTGLLASPESVLRELAELGVRIALDDFGTGYSSLTHVRRFNPSTLKIDRSFVAGIDNCDADRGLVTAIIGLAKALGMSTVAEGVERPAQRELLRSFGCDAIQGFLIAPAMSRRNVRTWAKRLTDSASSDLIQSRNG